MADVVGGDLSNSNIELLREISSFLLDPEFAVALFEDAPDPYIVINSNKRLELINKQAEALFGYDRTELYDKSIDYIFDNDILAPITTIFSSLASVFSDGVHTTAKNKKGETFQVSLHFAIIFTIQGPYMGVTLRKEEPATSIVT
jgi:PAS domain S-box-containing protein